MQLQERFGTVACLLTAALVVVACQEAPPVAPDSNATPAFSSGPTAKFEFAGVTLGEFEDAIVRIATKEHKKEKHNNTTCSYFAADQTYLGQYQEPVGFGPDEGAAALQFCVDNFDNRSL